MKKLIQGIIDFRKNRTKESQDLFARLALGQKPDALFIACSDSRVVPNLFASTNPGDLFVLRNIGNLVPPASASTYESGTASVIEFAVSILHVKDIIICGHSECGAMQEIMQKKPSCSCQHLTSWLKWAKPALQKVQRGITLDSSLSEANQISQMNVLEQMEHIISYPLVNKGLKNKTLNIHGWWFDIAQAEVYSYQKEHNKFVLIDSCYALA